MPIHLDHIIILLPHSQLLSPPPWLTQNFTLSPGGKHSDGKTENRLICFKDGSYIELISFIGDDPEKRKGHWWDKPYGIVDFAFTSTGPDATAQANFSTIQARLGRAVDHNVHLSYEPPRQGGRTRPDGQQIKWHVTFPCTTTGFQRGEVPFFCHDITQRDLRVPFSDVEATTHPSSVYGVDELSIYVPEERIAGLSCAFEALLGTPRVAEGDGGGVFKTMRMESVRGAEENVRFRIRAPVEEWQRRAMGERGGVLLGNMVVGGLSVLATPGMVFRIDVMEDGEQGSAEFGIGRVMRELR